MPGEQRASAFEESKLLTSKIDSPSTFVPSGVRSLYLCVASNLRWEEMKDQKESDGWEGRWEEMKDQKESDGRDGSK